MGGTGGPPESTAAVANYKQDAVEQFGIVYDGPALASHAMDVRELAPALLGIADLCQEANRILNGESAEVAVKVESEFRSGCFSVSMQLIQNVGTQALLDPSHLWTAKVLLEILGFRGAPSGTAGLIALVKWLRGRTITAIERRSDAPGISTVRAGDDVTIVNNGTLSVFNDMAARTALQQMVKPLEREGIGKLAVRQNDTPIERVRKDEVPYFAAVGAEQLLEEREDIGPFQIIKPSFDPRYKWMLSDGNGTLGVYIRDQRFFDQLERRQVTFAKGDVLKVRYKRTTWRTEGGLRAE